MKTPLCPPVCLHCLIGKTVLDFTTSHPDYPPNEVLADLLAIVGCTIVGGFKESGDEKTLENITSDLREFLKTFRKQEKLKQEPIHVPGNHTVQ